MSTLPEGGSEAQGLQETRSSAVPLTTRVSTVILGRMDFFSVLFRLIGMELYKIRRRLMSKVLGPLALLLAALASLAVGVELAVNLSTPAHEFVPACQAQSEGEPDLGCAKFSEVQLQQLKQAALSVVSGSLRLPSSLELAATQNEANPGVILVIILAGSMAGGEMGVGTVRLMFTRGPWRGQFLLAQYGAILICIVVTVLGMALVGVIAGQLFNLLSGVSQSFDFLNGVWLGHMLLYLLATMLNWFMYAVVAIFFGVLGRSAVAGVVGALTWFFTEPFLSSILALAGNFSLGVVSTFLHQLPNYFMGNNARSLQLSQIPYLFGRSVSVQGDIQALITLAVYLAVFVGLTWRLNESRDVTN